MNRAIYYYLFIFVNFCCFCLKFWKIRQSSLLEKFYIGVIFCTPFFPNHMPLIVFGIRNYQNILKLCAKIISFCVVPVSNGPGRVVPRHGYGFRRTRQGLSRARAWHGQRSESGMARHGSGPSMALYGSSWAWHEHERAQIRGTEKQILILILLNKLMSQLKERCTYQRFYTVTVLCQVPARSSPNM